ncbi:hypothetical protein JOF56_001972 [Kibdelosporangium banguiense]|uniref:Uncharacterized protein n=1 Tax=Kibdelosporangium banguiense TaxID=1365924 RepID=A0ABS4TAZ7_9PSEU|nr:hypothetical protein [Kibdelosporangium banguiense]MBP2321587.1 hypothetical protein [Kibdelosporangium banguiense]
MQKEAERPVLPWGHTGRKPVFASASGRRRRLVQLTSRLVAVSMVTLVTVVVATTLSAGHDSPPPWPVITIRSK